MKTEEDVDDFEERLKSRAIEADEDPESSAIDIKVHLYEACVPVEFWDFTDEHVQHNRAAFEKYVTTYCENWKTALKHGYGLLFLGANGTGKTMMLAWILRHAVRRHRSAYYTTTQQLDYDIRSGWQDKEARQRLEEMLSSDFLAIDELNKERVTRSGDSFVRDHVERILKKRFDDQLPTVLATNASLTQLEESLGESFASIVEGKYEVVMMEPGDFRKRMETDRRRRMGFPSRSS